MTLRAAAVVVCPSPTSLSIQRALDGFDPPLVARKPGPSRAGHPRRRDFRSGQCTDTPGDADILIVRGWRTTIATDVPMCNFPDFPLESTICVP
ncbi:hypothetical protein I552_2124 [Mycobacterium xenopi 3993]|nr:hypothetical protein I552_2124 [Mycobacterium xenopi 3993]